MSSFYGNGGYSSGGGGGSGEVISVNGKKGRVTLNAADVHALPEDTQIPSLEGFATEEWVNNQNFLTSEDISNKADISTTLSGYGITDAYTKTEINEMIPESNLTNVVDGSASGSVRGINTKSENSSYKIGVNAWAEGFNTMAKGKYSHAENSQTTASGTSSHAEGEYTTASGAYSHAEGSHTTASGAYSHAENSSTTASGSASHAEGNATKASAVNSHAEGNSTTASGPTSHAEGMSTIAQGNFSHAEGRSTIAQGYSQHAMGVFNTPQGSANTKSNTDYALIIGNGTSNDNRSNALAVKWDGTFVFANNTEITPAQFTSLYNINNKIPLTGNETEGQVLTIDANGNPKWDNTSFVKVTDDGQGNVSMETLYGVLIDAVPTQNSNNLVTSGGVYAYATQSPTIDFSVSSFTNNTSVTCNMDWTQLYNTASSHREKNIILHDTFQSFYCYKTVKTTGLGGVTISFYFLNENLNTQYVVKTTSSGNMTLLVNNLLSNYYTKTEIDTQIGNIETLLAQI